MEFLLTKLFHPLNQWRNIQSPTFYPSEEFKRDISCSFNLFRDGTIDLLDVDKKKEAIHPDVTTKKLILFSCNITSPDCDFQKAIAKIAATKKCSMPPPPPQPRELCCDTLSPPTTLSPSSKIATRSLLEQHKAAPFPIRQDTQIQLGLNLHGQA